MGVGRGDERWLIWEPTKPFKRPASCSSPPSAQTNQTVSVSHLNPKRTESKGSERKRTRSLSLTAISCSTFSMSLSKSRSWTSSLCLSLRNFSSSTSCAYLPSAARSRSLFVTHTQTSVSE